MSKNNRSIPHFYLASQSPRRKSLLQEHGFSFTQIPNLLGTEPRLEPRISIPDQVQDLALQKAMASVGSYQGLILGVDTVVVLDDLILGKPRDLQEATEMLSSLSDRTHSVYTGLGLYDSVSQKHVSSHDLTLVTFSPLTPSQIQDYCHRYEVLDKAGSYGIQDLPDGFVQSYEGHYDTVVGLPIQKLGPLFFEIL